MKAIEWRMIDIGNVLIPSKEKSNLLHFGFTSLSCVVLFYENSRVYVRFFNTILKFFRYSLSIFMYIWIFIINAWEANHLFKKFSRVYLKRIPLGLRGACMLSDSFASDSL